MSVAGESQPARSDRGAARAIARHLDEGDPTAWDGLPAALRAQDMVDVGSWIDAVERAGFRIVPAAAKAVPAATSGDTPDGAADWRAPLLAASGGDWNRLGIYDRQARALSSAMRAAFVGGIHLYDDVVTLLSAAQVLAWLSPAHADDPAFIACAAAIALRLRAGEQLLRDLDLGAAP